MAPPRSAATIAPPGVPGSLRQALPEFLRHGSPRLLALAVVLAWAIRGAIGGVSLGDGLALAALLAFWPVQEWLIHVFILHRRPTRWRGRTIDFRVPRKHRAHHADPWRLDLVFIPFHSFAYSLPLLVGIWWLFAPTAAIAWTGIAAHLTLTLHYEWVHFLCHTHVTPRSAWYRRLVRNHRRHHFKNEHYWFGVTMLAGDRLFATAPAPRSVPSSATARSLPAVPGLD
jgi:hypothetical protein